MGIGKPETEKGTDATAGIEQLVDRLCDNMLYFAEELQKAGFTLTNPPFLISYGKGGYAGTDTLYFELYPGQRRLLV